MKTALASFFTDIANAIRSKTGKSEPILAKAFASEISAIKTTPKLQQKIVTPDNTSKTVTADADYDGLSSVTVTAATIFGKTFDSGSFRVTEDTAKRTFSHSLGRIPDYIFITASGNTGSPDSVAVSLFRVCCKTQFEGNDFTSYISTITKLLNPTGYLADTYYESSSVLGDGCFSSVSSTSITVNTPQDIPLCSSMIYSYLVF